MKRLLWFIALVLKKIIESILVVIVLSYAVLVFDIYINTEKLAKVDGALNDFCQSVANDSNFKKGSVIFRVDRGTLVYRISPYINEGGLAGYAPFFIFPHNKTVILTEEALKIGRSFVERVVAHELGHIQGGIKHLGPVKEMEKYADDFANKVVNEKSSKEEPPK